MSYPIQPAKVQAPALRDEILARTRLLDWLETKIHCRVLFVIADAGYGKTTLLADFSRRTRLRTIWYRLDDDDRDWVGFLSHLVAAGREHDPDFASRTAAILRSVGPGGPTRDDAIEAFLIELNTIAPEGAALIFDDFHLADEIADVRHIAREIVTRAPERLSIVFASRRQPPVPVSKLRATGELAELGIAELRFSDAELEQLFRETYRRPLEPDVLTELAARTEGWAASLTLVRAALRERSAVETRSFIRSLSGARDELHDYLAEEVVGDLPLIHQQFLMRTSVLQLVTPELAQVATGLDAVEVQSLILESERLGLLGRRPTRRSTAQRYHPLVREFLEERLLRAVGAAGVRDLHVAVANWAETTDWRTAAHHFAAAGRWHDLRRVLDLHVETIVASGAFVTARDLVRLLPTAADSATAQVVLSRASGADGDYKLAADYAASAAKLAPTSDVVIGNLVAVAMLEGRYAEATALTDDFARLARSPLMRAVAAATRLVAEASRTGDLRTAVTACEALAEQCHLDGLTHFEGISWLNAALLYRAAGRTDASLSSARRAVDALSMSSAGPELAASRFAEAAALAALGRLIDSREIYSVVLPTLSGHARNECLVEWAELEGLLGDAEAAGRALSMVDGSQVGDLQALLSFVEAVAKLRLGNARQARSLFAALPIDDLHPNPGYRAQVLAFQALSAVLAEDGDSAGVARHAIQEAADQGARVWKVTAELALAAAEFNLSAVITSIPEDLRYAIAFASEMVVARLETLSEDALEVVRAVALSTPERWIGALRLAIASDRPSVLAAARLLELVGEQEDVPLLRSLARRFKRLGPERDLGRQLARRLAASVFISDLGRLMISVGTDQPSGRQVRRKVLALLCFMLARPRWSATREEVMEAMWPEMEPASAINSLNQTVYFLRREFEPNYTEDTSAGYVHQDSDLLWLDRDLINSASRQSVELIQEYERDPRPDAAVALTDAYRGRFALDFAYEDWSTDFREWLHVSYLHVVETQIRADIDNGNFQRGIQIARRALEVEPRNDELELSMLKLLRQSGAHSAAAEQYSRYANVLRTDLGVDPPPPESL